MLVDLSPILVAAYVAGSETIGMKLRVAAASFGLVTCSAVLVHLWDGVIEAHFHFFVVIGILTLYQDWMPFLVAIGYVVFHHGVMGALAPANVYNHPDAIAHPWKWAVIHGGFVLAASAAHIVAWRTNETQLLRDPLTGLPSRLLFLNRLTVALERLQRRRGRHVAVLFLDLDRFKVINDSLGHPAGDQLILAVAERLRHSLRRHETIARFGGDEFAILCEDIADEQDAIAVAERVLKTFGTPFGLADGDVTTGASVGIALSGNPDDVGEDLIRDADAAMYRAKESGGGRLELFDELTRQRAVARLQTENALRLAIEREELRVYFQPEVSIETAEIVGVEALVRWEHPERGLLGPGEFISLAEETGLIVPLGTWVMRESCRRARAWHDAGIVADDFSMRVNVSARQLASERLPGTVRQILADARPRAPPPVRRGDRDAADRGSGDVDRHALGAQGARREGRGRRLRHRLLLAAAPAQLPDRLREDRPLVRARPARQLRGRGDRRRGDRARPRARPVRDGRGRRDRRPAREPARLGLRHRPGLPVQPPGARRRDRGAPARGDRRARGLASGDPDVAGVGLRGDAIRRLRIVDDAA